MTCLEKQTDLDALIAYIREASLGSYIQVKALPDGSIAAIGDLMYTRAIFLGCTALGFESRFCFQDKALADFHFAALQSEDDLPRGYIARRGRIHPDHADYEIERLISIGHHSEADDLKKSFEAYNKQKSK